jgi:predicted secreted protein
VLQGPPPCQPQTVNVGDQNCGSPVNFCQGSTLRVVLTASGGSGYVWEQSANLNASILQPQGGPNVQQGSGPGAPDTYTWEYRAVGQGQTNLSFDLKRGAEAPIQSCGFPVGVQ